MHQGSRLGYNLHPIGWIETIENGNTKHKTKEPDKNRQERCCIVVGSLAAQTTPHGSLSPLRQNALALALTLHLLFFFSVFCFLFVSLKCALCLCSRLVTCSAFSLLLFFLLFICLVVQRLYLYLHSHTHTHIKDTHKNIQKKKGHTYIYI